MQFYLNPVCNTLNTKPNKWIEFEYDRKNMKQFVGKIYYEE